jgi:hypothetical protein
MGIEMTTDRRKALALAAAVTGVLGSTAVAVAAVTGVSVLGLGGGHAARVGALASYDPGTEVSTGVITRKEDVYDKIVVEGNPRAVAAAAPAGLMAGPAVPTPPAGAASQPAVVTPRPSPKQRRRSAPNTPTTVRTARSPQPASTPTSEPATEPTTPEPTDPPATLATTTTSTMPPVTTTSRPPGVPRDWPPGKPIPPMPPNCSHPQLEDNGVWNCGDD